ncbi:hypothetical protein Tco_0789959 [Tanacetum coccineum]
MACKIVNPPNNENLHTHSCRPKNTDRIKSQGEEPIQVRCSRCGVRGHNRTTCHEPIANYQDSTQPRLKRSRQTRQESNIHVDLGGHSQEYEATYTNNYVRSQEYEAAYTNNYVRLDNWVKVGTGKALDASLVNTESNGTKSKEQDTSSRSRDDAHDDDADINTLI